MESVNTNAFQLPIKADEQYPRNDMELQNEAKMESPTIQPGTFPPPRVNSSLLCFLRPNRYPNTIVPTVKIKKTIMSMIFMVLKYRNRGEENG